MTSAWSDWQTITLTAPNPVGNAVTPITATVGTPVTLTGTITNTGNADTGGSFPSWFILGSGSQDAGGDIFDNNIVSPSLAAGASEPFTDAPYTFTSPGTYSALICAGYGPPGATSWTRNPANSSGGGCGPWTDITVTAPSLPDLTAGAVSPTTAVAGTATTLSGTVSNIGTADTGTGFQDYFLVTDAANGSGNYVVVQNPTSPDLAVNASAPVSISYTFPASGTYSAIVCADEAPGWVNTINESNDGNNCGPWTNITVAAPAPPDLTTGTVPNLNADLGQPVPVSATAINNGPGSAAGFGDIFVTNLNNSQTAWNTMVDVSNGPLSQGASVAVPYTFPASTFSAPGNYYYAFCADYNSSWQQPIPDANPNNNCTNWGIITITQPICYGEGCNESDGGSCNSGCSDGCAYDGISQPSSNAGECCSSTPGVCAVVPTAALLVNGSASGTTIDNGQSATLTWSSANASSCTAVGGFSTGGAASNGSGGAVSPGTTSQYQIQCTGTGGSAYSNTVTVIVLNPVAKISANPVRVAAGAQTTLTWSGTQVDSCTVTDGSGDVVQPQSNADGNGNWSAGSPASVTVAGQSTYTITCQTGGSPVTVSQTVTVNENGNFTQF